MPSYTLLGNISIVQVLGPQLSAEMVEATIQTQPTGIIAAMLVPQESFDSGEAATELAAFADAIEAVIAQGKAVSGTGTSHLDKSRLQQYYVVFEVVYNPPGAPPGAVTVDVEIHVSLLDVGTLGPGMLRRESAEEIIDAAYANLVAMSQG